MKIIIFSPDAISQLKKFKSVNPKLVFKILDLVENIQQQPFSGLGQPEALKGELKGYWSRRIDQEHRLVYSVTNDAIHIQSCYGHYSDK